MSNFCLRTFTFASIDGLNVSHGSSLREYAAQSGKPVPFGIRLQFKLADRLVFKKIRAAFGGRVRMFITGAAPTPMDVLRATFPAGTVSGAPKIRAMEIIDELEPVKRGVYGGAVGYISWAGDMDTAIAIRTAVIKDGRLYVQAGGGVVADSIPRLEWKETHNKARAMFRAASMVLADDS